MRRPGPGCPQRQELARREPRSRWPCCLAPRTLRPCVGPLQRALTPLPSRARAAPQRKRDAIVQEHKEKMAKKEAEKKEKQQQVGVPGRSGGWGVQLAGRAPALARFLVSGQRCASPISAPRCTARPRQGWFELKNNTSVYVTGLPFDTNEKEVAAVFAKCGIIKEGPDMQPRIKLYRWAGPPLFSARAGARAHSDATSSPCATRPASLTHAHHPPLSPGPRRGRAGTRRRAT